MIGCAVGQKMPLQHLSGWLNPPVCNAVPPLIPISIYNVHSNLYATSRPLHDRCGMVVAMAETVSNWQPSSTEESADLPRARRASQLGPRQVGVFLSRARRLCWPGCPILGQRDSWPLADGHGLLSQRPPPPTRGRTA
jgi:hypothetical protein